MPDAVRLLTAWAEDAARFADVLALQDPSWGARHHPFAGGRLVLCGTGMYVNRALAAGITAPIRPADIEVADQWCRDVGVPLAVDVTRLTTGASRRALEAAGIRPEPSSATAFTWPVGAALPDAPDDIVIRSVSAAALGVALAAPAGAEDKSFANTGEWAKAFTNPAFMEGMTRMMSPEMMQAWMQVMFNPDMVNAMMSSMGDMMDPALFQQWMKAAMNPEMMAAAMKFADPEMMQPMLKVMFSPKMMETMMSLATPEMMETMANFMANPATWEAMTKMADPELMTSMMQTAFSPEMMEAMMKFADPEMMSGYIDMMTDPAFMDQMMKMMDPEMMAQMMAAMFKMSMAMPAAMAKASETMAEKDDAKTDSSD